MTAPVAHIIRNQHFWLSPQRCLFWEEQRALILSDLHFGKTGHFRKHGIAVPQEIYKEDLQRLVELISYFKPRQLIAVGDLFHSVANKEMDWFLKWRRDLRELAFVLVKGNHDILTNEWYAQAGIDVQTGTYTVAGFDFVHDPEEAEDNGENYIFSGHLHPGVHVNGLGKQSLQFPCYYFGKAMAILPAFSKFSGLAIIRKKKADTVYAIVNQSLVAIQ
ncbi:MAG: ligase-associated DNA damage response endonuclease PdeM [Bacteroidetes bacterium]|nr:ligase-associated DNA damage response endonuclease PdeM [Bacteroidota bacterium]